MISSCRCLVYSGAGMLRKAILYLAQQHNSVNALQRKTTFAEVAANCHRLMFTHFAESGMEDNNEYMPKIPRFDSRAYIEWKRECMCANLSTDVVGMRFSVLIRLLLKFIT